MPRHRGRVGGLFHELEDPVAVIHLHHPKGLGLGARHLDAAHGHIRPAFHMLADHQRIVLLVDVIPRQDDDVFRPVAADDVDVLRHRVGGALVPVLVVQLLRRGQDIERLVALGAKEAPAALQVPDQRMRLVLRRHPDPPDAGIDRVRQGEVDDPGLAAEIHRGFGADVGQLVQSAAAPAGQHESHGLLRKSLGLWIHLTSSLCQSPPRGMSPRSSSKNIVESGGRVSDSDCARPEAATGSLCTAPRLPRSCPP